MNWLVLGHGSIAKRHIKNLRTLWPDSDITCLLTHRALTENDNAPAGADRITDDFDACLEQKYDGAIIATPASEHLRQARRLLEKSIPLLIEKPLSVSCEQCEELQSLAQTKNVPVLTGYILRFFPITQRLHDLISHQTFGPVTGLKAEVGSYLPDWRPDIDYRKSVSASRALGGGALLELSHEIDYVYWLLGMPKAVLGKLDNSGELEIDCEDSVDIQLAYTDFIAAIHMDFLQKPPVRRCSISFDKAEIEADFISGELLIRQQQQETKENLALKDPDEAFRNELRHFNECILGRSKPRVSLREACDIMHLIDQIRRSSDNGKEVYLENT